MITFAKNPKMSPEYEVLYRILCFHNKLKRKYNRLKFEYGRNIHSRAAEAIAWAICDIRAYYKLCSAGSRKRK